MLQVVFALNEQYWLNEKGALALAETFAIRPASLQTRIEEVFARLAAESEAIRAALAILEGIARDTEILAAGQ